ncbi:short-chain dehydrogenase TIC 32, chloroplastic-like [Zingiber officinale]|uniref:short-chain dehydrogenase TIC 32, chloroplastic-like n=1 Tax=Zingiber officinale TaxID=94328 RepID=UPI001C4CF068|nr:short-chain dehydrogenase TIC 32, chloroplastic-like [Zingiber officinale]
MVRAKDFGRASSGGGGGLVRVIPTKESQVFFQGVATTCYVALHSNLRGVTGKYFDEELSRRLWDLSEKMLKPMSKEHSSQENK